MGGGVTRVCGDLDVLRDACSAAIRVTPTFSRNGDDTNGLPSPGSPRRKARPRAGRESKEREPDPRWGRVS